MIVNIGLILAFWILLRFEKKDLNVFGFQPLPRRLFQLLLGFFSTAILSILIHILFGYTADFSWSLNDNYGIDQLLDGTYKTFNSVVFEELVFRTYVLYKLFQLLGEKKAILITSSIFGIYHWFTFGFLGNYPMMIWIFFYTGLWGMMFAYGYSRMGTILFAIGLHWGWNFFDQIIFNKNGGGLLKPMTSDHTLFLNQTSGFLVTTLPPILFALMVIYYLTHKKPLNQSWKPRANKDHLP